MVKLRLVKREHTVVYGMRLFKDEVFPDQEHPRVEVETPDGEQAAITMHAIAGDKEEIRRKLHESIDAFFEIYGEDL